MGEVDPAFIQHPEHRPKLSVPKAEGIPLIDLSPLNSSDNISDPKAIGGVVREIGNACKEWGFFQVINHGVLLDKRKKIEDAARKFFAQPLEEKRKITRDEKSLFGYYDTEHTKNVRDWKEVFDFAVEDPMLMPASLDPEDKEETKWTNQWPEYPQELRVASEEYTEEVEKLALKLMGLIALSLGVPADRFNSYFKDQTSFIRLNYYPPCPSPQLALGVGRHKDSGALTVLAQDEVGGLEVKRKRDGEWIQVKPTPNAYIINVGDIIQVWSNDRYESVEHRVLVNSERGRFSIPYFVNPAHYTLVKPLEELTHEQEDPAKYKPYSWGKFLSHRKLSNFKKHNAENIQLYHFRVSE
ncbi:PREDICTED: protein DMR6-LIKE OXYGENASE 2 [Prunus mume]|uniref:Protein DMR6-LIKE OXYGENASE 2 n=1 Tax=Prunus mume TaxID=102107 RepID=A0ABM0PAF6_PRUMU|nr:PREDICTED: protein DMR6-LIKE OXYGENASE 2 [Prunus mume]